MQASMGGPEPVRDRPQFNLLFVFYAVTVLAAACAVLRLFVEYPLFLTVFGAYLLVMSTYAMFRIPILVRRYVRSHRASQLRREAMAASLEETRAKQRSDESA